MSKPVNKKQEVSKRSSVPKKDSQKREILNKNNDQKVLEKKTNQRPRDNT